MNKRLLLSLCFMHLIIYAGEDLHYYNQIRSHKPRFFTEIYYQTVKPIVSDIKKLLFDLPSSLMHEWLLSHPYDQTEATVRFTDEDALCEAENQFTTKRLTHVKHGCEQLLNIDIPHERVPRIAVCCSGGGYRAMFLSLGFFKGLQDIGLLDCTTYMSGLSGSTWAMAPWVASKQPLNDFIDSLPNKVCHGLKPIYDLSSLDSIAKKLVAKALNGQFLSSVDLYGDILANSLLTDFGTDRLRTNLSESHAHIVDGSFPMPIYTAVTPNADPYEWFEFTPFEVGSSYLKAYIPTWAYGRKFKYGHSINFAAEQSLGYMMGVYGSAYAVNLEEIVHHTQKSLQAFANHFPSAIQNVMHKMVVDLIDSPLDDVRLAPSSLPNYVYKTATRPLNTDKTITLIDAGIDCNLPFAPLLREERKVDIILTCDASGKVEGAPSLRCAQEYMQARGLAFPPIDFEAADKQVMSVFKDDSNPNCPIVVYFPRIKNEAYSQTFDPDACKASGYCNTLNFTYSQEQLNELMGLAEFGVKQHADALVALVQEVVNR